MSVGFFPENKPNGVCNRSRRIRSRRRLPENKFVWDADSLVGACKTKEQQLGFCRGARKSGPGSVHSFVATLDDECLPKSVATWAAQRKEGRKEGDPHDSRRFLVIKIGICDDFLRLKLLKKRGLDFFNR
jgi:hypothetical protein